jgi:L-lactate dehydrogenase
MSTKITVIGAGSVGAAITNDIMVQGIASEVVLIDINKEKAMGEALLLVCALAKVAGEKEKEER